MLNIFRSLMGILLSALLLASCQATTGKTAGQNVDDGAITTRVNAALVTDKPSFFTRVDVDTNNGVVTLKVLWIPPSSAPELSNWPRASTE
jgi:hypothetical protein